MAPVPDRGPRVLVGPEPRPEVVAAVRRGGGRVVEDLAEAEAVVWLSGSPDGFPAPLPDAVRWVQLPAAGVERWVSAGLVDHRRAWTSAAGAFSATVAEHALALVLAGLRRVPEAARAGEWRSLGGRELRGAEVLVVGAGGIGQALLALLAPFGVSVTAVTRSGRVVAGADRALAARDLPSAWGDADVVVLCAPATGESAHLVGEAALRSMRPHALLVNVARGSLVDTDALVTALVEGWIGGAALDVVDPEPLPAGHPLWEVPNAVVTPHAANPASAYRRDLAERVAQNVVRFAQGRDLVAPVLPERGY